MPVLNLAAALALTLASLAHAESTPVPKALPTLPVLAALTQTVAVEVSRSITTSDPGAGQQVTKTAQVKSRSPWVRSQAQWMRVQELEDSGYLSAEQASAFRKRMIGIRSRYGMRKGKPDPKLEFESRRLMDKELDEEEAWAHEAQRSEAFKDR